MSKIEGIEDCTIEELIEEIAAVVSDGFPFGYPHIPPERCGDVMLGLKLVLLARERSFETKDTPK